MNSIVIEAFGDKIECKEFFDIVGTSTEVSGVEIFRDGERLGQMIGTSIPDIEDTDAVDDFRDEVEVWLVDNEY
jgi:hypothetical protein